MILGPTNYAISSFYMFLYAIFVHNLGLTHHFPPFQIPLIDSFDPERLLSRPFRSHVRSLISNHGGVDYSYNAGAPKIAKLPYKWLNYGL